MGEIMVNNKKDTWLEALVKALKMAIVTAFIALIFGMFATYGSLITRTILQNVI